MWTWTGVLALSFATCVTLVKSFPLSFIKQQGAGGGGEQGGSGATSKHGAAEGTRVLDLEDLIRIPALVECDLGRGI